MKKNDRPTRGDARDDARDAENYHRMPSQQVMQRGKTSGGSHVLAAVAAILVTLLLTFGAIVGTTLLRNMQATDDADAEQVEDATTKVTAPEAYTISPVGSGDGPIRNIDANGQSTGKATTGDVATNNPTQTFFASRGTLSDTAELGYLGQRLNEEEQRVYLQLHAAIAGGRENVDMIEIYNEHSIDYAWQCLFDDHPEFFWLDGKYTYVYDPMNHTLNVQFGIAVPLYELGGYKQQVEAKAIEFQNSIPADASQYDIALKAYEYIIYNTEYDESADYNQTILSVFSSGRSVCAGYARAYQYLLHRAGMFCSFVHGQGHSEDGGTESHAWDLIQIDGQYCYVDPTWGDKNPRMVSEGQPAWGEIRYAYFGMPTEEVLKTGHEFEHQDWWPAADSYDYNVYHRAGMLFDHYDRTWFQGLVKSQVHEGKSSMEFQFTNPEAWQACLTDGGTEECLEDLPEWMDCYRASWTFLSNNTTRTIRLTWQED